MKRSILVYLILAMIGPAWDCAAQAQTRPTTSPVAAPGGGFGRGPGGAGRGPGAFGGNGGRGFGAPPGPPAPVPPQVAIPRPSPAELAQLNDAVKKFIDSDNSPTKPLLQKYQSLLMVQAPRANSAVAPVPRNAQRHANFVEIAQKGDIDLLLHGDSITDWWVQGEDNRKMFEKYFGNIKTANFAIAGDTTQGLLWGLQNGEGQGFQPKAIMLMIGTNNSGGNTAPEIAEGVGAVVLEMRKDFPNAKILLLAIFPRGNPGDPVRQKIAEVNQIIARLDDQQHVFFMDIGAKFLDEKGVFLPDAFRTDNLHPQAKGYDIWGQAVKEKLDSLMR